MTHPRLVAGTLALCVAAAFALRTIPSYHLVFSPGEVNFQESDGWFHMRTVHNLMAHFPFRSGFDPYAVYPGGANVPTGPMFDYVLGSGAGLLGAGSPSPELVDKVGAWTPAVLGASFPLLVFWLGRRLFSEFAGLFAAAWIALMPGGFLWTGHLGMTDHHVLETWLALATFGLVGAAMKAAPVSSRRALWLTAAAGLALGAFLLTRPAGVFVPAILMAAVVLHPARILALTSLGTFVVGTLVFLPAVGVLWSEYTLLSLAAGIGVSLLVLGIDWIWRRRHWPSATVPLALLVIVAAAVLSLTLLQPRLLMALKTEILRVAGYGPESRFVNTVTEMQPLIRAYGSSPLDALFQQLGVAWMFAIPALAVAAVWAWRVRRPEATLFVVWSAVMTVAGFMETRMVVYFAVNAALLAGAACAWLSGFGSGLQRRVTTVVLGVVIVATNLVAAVPQMKISAGPGSDWRQALDWLRDHSPEPMNDAAAYFKRFPALRAGQSFDYPPSAYSVAVWWDFGYWVESIARRMPSSNGTQAGATVTARLLTDTSAEDARITVSELGARYIVLDPTVALFDRLGRSQFTNVLIWSRRFGGQYLRLFFSNENGSLRPVVFYLPDFYRSMAVRLYTFDGKPARPQSVWVVSSRPYSSRGGLIDVIQQAREFGTEQEAREFIAQHPEDTLTLGGMDPSKTCVELEAVPDFREVFSSDTRTPEMGRAIRGVKVFEIVR
jgi:oligosaccharyl transferase (archaeosortase A-associated)